jgi:hypothetical protein
MQEITVVFKNLTPKVEAMVKSTFKQAPTLVTGRPLEEKPDNLTIDFNDIKDPIMLEDMEQALFVHLMAFSWLIVKRRQDETKGN